MYKVHALFVKKIVLHWDNSKVLDSFSLLFVHHAHGRIPGMDQWNIIIIIGLLHLFIMKTMVQFSNLKVELDLHHLHISFVFKNRTMRKVNDKHQF